MINLPALADRLNEIGVMEKAFIAMNKDEVMAFCQAVVDNLEREPWTMPYWRPQGGERVLVMPADAPPVYRTWLYDPNKNHGRIVLYHLLRTIGATEMEMAAYLGEAWREDAKEYDAVDIRNLKRLHAGPGHPKNAKG